jgi:adenylate kinase family enzyme
MRAEKERGTRDGERIRKIMNEGGLVPFELTVQILINGLLANPSKVFPYYNLMRSSLCVELSNRWVP